MTVVWCFEIPYVLELMEQPDENAVSSKGELMGKRAHMDRTNTESD